MLMDRGYSDTKQWYGYRDNGGAGNKAAASSQARNNHTAVMG